MVRTLLALSAVLTLTGCAQGYTYVYDYDPLMGPRGHYLETPQKHPNVAPDCANPVFAGPIENGYRGAYVAGPFCAP